MDQNRTKWGIIGTVLMLLLSSCSLAWAQGANAHYDTIETAGPFGSVIPITNLGKFAVGLQVKEVLRRSLPLQLTTPGRIEAIPTHQFAQHSPVSGRVSEVLVNPGDLVSKGQILLELQSPELNKLTADIIQAKQELEAQIAQQQCALNDEVKQAKVRIDLAQQNYNRDCKLFDQQVGSQKQMQTSLAELEVANSQYRTALGKRDLTLRNLRAKLKLILLPLKQRLEMLGEPESSVNTMLQSGQTVTMAPVKSARSGIVTSLDASAGQSIDPSVRLCTVSDLSKVWATAHVYEDDMGRIKVGQRVSVRVPAFSHESFNGVLSYIGSSVDSSRTLPVRAEIHNQDYRLKPDMYADLSIQIGQPTLAVLLPQQAIVEHNGHSLAFVAVKGGFQPTRVVVGRSFGDLVEIVDGIATGQRVVTQGAFQLAAELIKSTGDTSMFQQATEGEREKVGEEAPIQNNNPALSWQVLAVGITIAFILGFVISAVASRTRSSSKHDTTFGSETKPKTEESGASPTQATREKP